MSDNINGPSGQSHMMSHDSLLMEHWVIIKSTPHGLCKHSVSIVTEASRKATYPSEVSRVHGHLLIKVPHFLL